MAIIDYDDGFTSAGGQAITAAAIATRVKDAGVARDWGAGENVHPYMRVTGDAAFNPGTSAQVDIIAADSADLTSNPVVLATRTIPAAALVAGSLHQLPDLLSASQKRYLGAKVTPIGGNATTGKVVIGLLAARFANGVNAL